MKKIKFGCVLSVSLIIAVSVIMAKSAEAEEYGDIEFPDGAVSFADAVISYNPGSGVGSSYDDPTQAEGIPDDEHVSLGVKGILILQFKDNSLIVSGGDSKECQWCG